MRIPVTTANEIIFELIELDGLRITSAAKDLIIDQLKEKISKMNTLLASKELEIKLLNETLELHNLKEQKWLEKMANEVLFDAGKFIVGMIAGAVVVISIIAL